ncbi:MAG: hypothetical protein ABIO49_01920, partial [Dokdonella sp.]
MIDVMLARVMILMLTAPLALQKLYLPHAGGKRSVQPKTRPRSALLNSRCRSLRAQMPEAHPKATALYDDVATVLTLAHNS